MSKPNEFRILVIDDNPEIHRDFIKILKLDNHDTKIDKLSSELFSEKKEISLLPQFEIDLATQGQEGLQCIEKAIQEGRPYSLAFVDIRMPPGWDGIETIKHIWEVDKEIQIVICTAYSDYSWEETVSHLGKTDNLLILKKPFDNVSVRQLAAALTRKWKLAEDSRNYTSNLKQQVADRTLSLQQSLSLVKSTFESASDGIVVISKQGEIIDYNQKILSMLEIPKEVIDKKNEQIFLNHLIRKLDRPNEFLERINDLHQNPDEISIDVINYKNGKVFECYTQPHRLNNKIVGRILDFRDITKRALLERELKFQATHDHLTGLDNRVKLQEKMRIAIKNADNAENGFSVLFIDLDRFKLVNDSLSHQVGDELLQAAANRLKDAIRSEDTLARVGGDEFVLLLMNTKKDAILDEKAKRLVSIFQQAFFIANRNITLTASIGISVYPEDGMTSDVLLRDADSAMYQAKAKKGNRYEYYSKEMSLQNLAEFDQEMELRQAIEKNEFFLCYQPQLDLMNEKLVAVEALIRWKHPRKGICLPLDFIPLAEETGLIIPISDWVLKTAVQQNKAWQEQGFPPIRVAVNITAQQFKQPDFVLKVEKVLKESGLKPEYLELELTENVILSHGDILRCVRELKDLGVFIAIDDFGTGYSSLSFLHKIPFDRLKIDSSFIQHIQSATDDEVIVRAVIAMAKNLNLEVLAEGVENIDQINFLKRHQCGDVQGYYFSQPLSRIELEKYFHHPDVKTIQASLHLRE